jgi:hypothetical protein
MKEPLLAVRCLICQNEALRSFVDGGLNTGLSNSGIAASIVSVGGKLDPDVIARHKRGHWVKPLADDSPRPTGRDLAIIMRDKVAEAVGDMAPEHLLYMGKDLAPMVGKGLQAQAILDKREQVNKKLGIAAGALSLQAWLAGLRDAPAPSDLVELDDPNVIEGVIVLHSEGEDRPNSEE